MHRLINRMYFRRPAPAARSKSRTGVRTEAYEIILELTDTFGSIQHLTASQLRLTVSPRVGCVLARREQYAVASHHGVAVFEG